MKRLAVFVEGRTELLFVSKLLEEIAETNDVRIEHREIRGGTSTRRTFSVIRAAAADTGQSFYVLLVDCGGDDLVKSRILEEHESLSRVGYERIIGIRDVRPKFSLADVPRLEAGLPKYIKTSLIPVEFVLSIMEIEAWFLAEFSHYPKIHPAITLDKVIASLGFDPRAGDLSDRERPTDDLDACYKIGRETYNKANAGRTIECLDVPYVYLEMPGRIPYLKKLADSLDRFLAKPM